MRGKTFWQPCITKKKIDNRIGCEDDIVVVTVFYTNRFEVQGHEMIDGHMDAGCVSQRYDACRGQVLIDQRLQGEAFLYGEGNV
jgi:hypothetical protein